MKTSSHTTFVSILLLSLASLSAFGCGSSGTAHNATPEGGGEAADSDLDSEISEYLGSDDPLAIARREEAFDVFDKPSYDQERFVYQIKYSAIGKGFGFTPHSLEFRWSDYTCKVVWVLPAKPEDNEPALMQLSIDVDGLDPATLGAIASKALVTESPDFSTTAAASGIAMKLARALQDSGDNSKPSAVEETYKGIYITAGYHPRASSDHAADATIIDFTFRLRPPPESM